jgi:hypothetical protein
MLSVDVVIFYIAFVKVAVNRKNTGQYTFFSKLGLRSRLP